MNDRTRRSKLFDTRHIGRAASFKPGGNGRIRSCGSGSSHWSPPAQAKWRYIWQGIAARWGRDQSFAPWHRSSNRRSATPRDHFHQRAAGSCSASGFLDLNLLLLLRHLRWLWQVDVQYALIKLCLDLRRVGIEWQRDRPAKRAIAAFHHVPVLVLVLFIARGLFLTAEGQHPIGECYVEIFLINAWQLGCHFNRVLGLSNVDLRRKHVRPELRERATL